MLFAKWDCIARPRSGQAHDVLGQDKTWGFARMSRAVHRSVAHFGNYHGDRPGLNSAQTSWPGFI